MPFESSAQRAWMFANKPAMAKRWANETPKGTKLPYHIGDNNMRKNHYEKGSIPPQGKKRVGGTMGRKARIVASLRKAKKMKGSHYSVPAQMA